MNRSKTQLDRVFVRPEYALHYRRAARASWTSEARADYVLLFLLEGSLSSRVEAVSFETHGRSALLLNPGVSAAVSGRNAEYLRWFSQL